MSVRRGADEFMTPGQYAPIEVINHARKVVDNWVDGEIPELELTRLAKILGVTEGGEFTTPEVDTYGEKLWTNGDLGVDLLVVPPHSGFPTHIHPGHHLLLCIGGSGTFSVDGRTFVAEYGELHMIEASVPHAVGNPNPWPHILLAFGCPPRELDSADRMRVVDWNGQPVHAPAD